MHFSEINYFKLQFGKKFNTSFCILVLFRIIIIVA